MNTFRRPFPHVPALVMDAGLAALVAVGTFSADMLGPDQRTTAAYAWDIALALPLILRRRAPATTAAAVGLLALAQWANDTVAMSVFVPLIVLYTLAAWERRRWLLVTAALVAELGVVMAVLRWLPTSEGVVTGLMATGTVTASWVIGIYVRTRRAYLASMIERAETAERDRDNQARVAVAAERARMAREMHDVITHSLSIMITLNDAAAAVTDSEQVHGTVTQASEVGRQALAEMQRMLRVLRTDTGSDLTPQPGAAQLSDLIAIVRSAGLSVELAVTGDLTGLALTEQLVVYRIVQESLTNVLKHARNVTHVTVDIVRADDSVSVRVHNDGDVVTSAGSATDGHGVAGMRERAALFGGRLTAGPAAGGGWTVAAGLFLRGATTADPAGVADSVGVTVPAGVSAPVGVRVPAS